MARRMSPEDRVNEIARAAVAVFMRRGYHQTQMGEIAKEAGVANGTVYHYFESKIQLFLYVIENGIPTDGASTPSPESFSGRTEQDLLEILKEDLKKRGHLKSVEKFLKKKRKDIDLAEEISEIFHEWWGVMEGNRIQIAILEKSSSEFPELEEIYDKYGRRYLHKQINEYLSDRVEKGVIRHLNSIHGMTFAMMESLAWFSWKQDSFNLTPYCPKEDILPDLIATFSQGLDNSG